MADAPIIYWGNVYSQNVIAAIEANAADNDSIRTAVDHATSELRRIREGAVLTDLIEDVSA
jgi:hypothetical protein